MGDHEKEDLRRSVAAFMADEAPPETWNAHENAGTYPLALCQRMAELGWLGMAFPEELGGGGGGIAEMCVLAEELARHGGYDAATLVGIPTFAGLAILEHGTREQRAEVIPSIASGAVRMSIAYTEPQTGSDVTAIATSATADPDGTFTIRGEKSFISMAHVHGTLMQVSARTGGTRGERTGLSIFLLPNDAAGVSVTPVPALGRSMTGMNRIHFDEVRAGRDCVLGPVGEGWSVLLSGLGFERCFTSAAYVGAAQGVVDLALAHAAGREQFGRRIGDFQAIAHMLADMQTRVDAARGLLGRAVDAMRAGRPAGREVSQAKLFGSETFAEVAGAGMQILGAHGYALESSMQRHFRDARSTTIAAGTSQIHRDIIARSLGLRPNGQPWAASGETSRT